MTPYLVAVRLNQVFHTKFSELCWALSESSTNGNSYDYH